MRAIRRAMAVLAIATMAILAPLPAEAADSVATCGALLTHDAHLATDLICPGEGVKMAGGTRLDLRGHSLTGSGSGTAVAVTGRRSVTVTNGRIAHWGIGVADSPDFQNDDQPDRVVTISTVRFADNGTAVDTSSQLGPFGPTVTFTIARSTFTHNGTGVSGLFSSPTTIAGSVFTDNDAGVQMNTSGVRISHSRFERNQEAASCDESFCEVRWSRFEGNTTAISVWDVAGLSLDHSTLRRNDVAVSVDMSEATVTGNLFVQNGLGITTSMMVDSSQATLTANLFLRNRDGISTTEPAIRLRGNVAAFNRQHGIYAPLATDLGGNRAYRNRISPQCTGVRC
jgi:hypothetical protein